MNPKVKIRSGMQVRELGEQKMNGELHNRDKLSSDQKCPLLFMARNTSVVHVKESDHDLDGLRVENPGSDIGFR